MAFRLDAEKRGQKGEHRGKKSIKSLKCTCERGLQNERLKYDQHLVLYSQNRLFHFTLWSVVIIYASICLYILFFVLVKLFHEARIWTNSRPCTFHQGIGSSKTQSFWIHQKTDDYCCCTRDSCITVDQHHTILQKINETLVGIFIK